MERLFVDFFFVAFLLLSFISFSFFFFFYYFFVLREKQRTKRAKDYKRDVVSILDAVTPLNRTAQKAEESKC